MPPTSSSTIRSRFVSSETQFSLLMEFVLFLWDAMVVGQGCGRMSLVAKLKSVAGNLWCYIFVEINPVALDWLPTEDVVGRLLQILMRWHQDFNLFWSPFHGFMPAFHFLPRPSGFVPGLGKEGRRSSPKFSHFPVFFEGSFCICQVLVCSSTICCGSLRKLYRTAATNGKHLGPSEPFLVQKKKVQFMDGYLRWYIF